RPSIPDILQEPLRRNLAPHPALRRLLVDPAADGGELQALVAHVAVEGHLIARGAAGAFARNEIGEIRLLAAAAAVAGVRAVAAHARLRVLRRDTLHLFDRAADVGGGREAALGLEALGLAHLDAGGALAHDYVEAVDRGVGNLAAAEIGDVHSCL